MKAKTTGVGPAAAVFLSLFAFDEIIVSSEAAQPTYEELMAACKTKYGKKVVKATIGKDGSVTCHLPPGRPTQKQAVAACRAKYGKKATGAVINKDNSVTCQGQAREMTRSEVYEECRKKYHATTMFIEKKKSGWLCRYHGLY